LLNNSSVDLIVGTHLERNQRAAKDKSFAQAINEEVDQESSSLAA
jgi:hypothetical protein